MDYVRQSTLFLSERAFKIISQRAEAELTKKVGCTLREMWILLLIDDAELSQRRIGEAIGVHPNVLVKMLDSLERRGFVVRSRRRSDRREQVIEATEKGKAAFKTYVAERSRLLREAFRPLSDKQIEQWETLAALILGF